MTLFTPKYQDGPHRPAADPIAQRQRTGPVTRIRDKNSAGILVAKIQHMQVSTKNAVTPLHPGRWTLGLAVIAALCCATWDAWAQRPVIEGAASGGSGASFGSGDGRTVVLVSPFFIDIDIIYYNDEVPTLEYVVGFQAELQGRVSAGIVPQLRFTTAKSPWMLYGLIGAPFVVAPFVLLGVEGGGGLLYRLTPQIGFFAEVVLDLFIIGNDLPDEGILVQLDASLGVRVAF